MDQIECQKPITYIKIKLALNERKLSGALLSVIARQIQFDKIHYESLSEVGAFLIVEHTR